MPFMLSSVIICTYNRSHLLERTLPNLRYVTTETNMGLASAANLGIKAAKGEYLLFTDDVRAIAAARSKPL